MIMLLELIFSLSLRLGSMLKIADVLGYFGFEAISKREYVEKVTN